MGKVVVAYQGQRCPESECQGCSPNSNLQARASGASQKACWLSQDQCFSGPKQASCHRRQSGIGRMKRKPPGPLDIKAVKEQGSWQLETLVIRDQR